MYYAVYKSSNKELVSIGTSLPDTMPDGLSSKQITATEYNNARSVGYIWNTSNQTFTFNSPPLSDGATISSSTNLPAGRFTFMLDASNGSFDITPPAEGGDYTFIRIDNTSNLPKFKGTVNGNTDYEFMNQYSNARLIGSNGIYFNGGNN